MKIDVKVVPGAKKSLLKQEGEVWKVYLQAPAVEGKANAALIKLLAGHFGVRKAQVKITKGLKSRLKTVSIKGLR